MQQHNPQEFELFSPPTDGISAVRFAPGENLLLVSSWDSVCFSLLRISLTKFQFS
jgi:hypothetical protein